MKILVRDESTVPAEFKDKVEIVKGDVLNQDDVEKTVQGTDAVIIVLGTRNSTAPTTMMSDGTKNIIQAMKKNGLTKFSACMSSFVFMQPEMVPKVFTDLNADHKRMLEAIKESGLEYRAVLPPHIASKFNLFELKFDALNYSFIFRRTTSSVPNPSRQVARPNHFKV